MGCCKLTLEVNERNRRALGLYRSFGFAQGMLQSVKFGVRGAEHTRDTHQTAQGPNFAADPFNPANLPAWNGGTYPGDFGNRLGGNWPRQVWMLDPNVLDSVIDDLPRTLHPTNDHWLTGCARSDRELLDRDLGGTLTRWGYPRFADDSSARTRRDVLHRALRS